MHQENNAYLSYWLSNTVTLLYLMQKNVKPASGGGYAARIKASSQQVGRVTCAHEQPPCSSHRAPCCPDTLALQWHACGCADDTQPSCTPIPPLTSPSQVTRGLFASSKGSFTSFFTRTGYGGGSPAGGEASIHGGAMGGFRQVRHKGCWILFTSCL